MTLEALFTDALHRIEAQYDLKVTLSEARAGKVFPEVDRLGRRIFFNPKIKAFVTLYNLMLLYPRSGSEAISLFTLYNLYMDTDSYEQASSALHALEREVARLHRMLWWKSKRPVIHSVDMQVLFILLHEAAHVVFYDKPELRQEYVGRARQRVEGMRIDTAGLPERMEEYMNSFIPDGLPEAIRREMAKEQREKMKQYVNRIFDFDVYLNPDDDSMLEEFSCDEMAWSRTIVQYMETTLSGERILETNIDILMALYILDYDRCIQAIYTNMCEERLAELPRMAGVRHASLRECIYRFYKDVFPYDHSHTFLRQSEARDEGGKRLLIPSMFNHIADMAALQDKTPRKYTPVRIQELETHFQKIEGRILDFLRS